MTVRAVLREPIRQKRSFPRLQGSRPNQRITTTQPSTQKSVSQKDIGDWWFSMASCSKQSTGSPSTGFRQFGNAVVIELTGRLCPQHGQSQSQNRKFLRKFTFLFQFTNFSVGQMADSEIVGMNSDKRRRESGG